MKASEERTLINLKNEKIKGSTHTQKICESKKSSITEVAYIPDESVKTNIGGAENVIKAAL